MPFTLKAVCLLKEIFYAVMVVKVSFCVFFFFFTPLLTSLCFFFKLLWQPYPTQVKE